MVAAPMEGDQALRTFAMMHRCGDAGPGGCGGAVGAVPQDPAARERGRARQAADGVRPELAVGRRAAQLDSPEDGRRDDNTTRHHQGELSYYRV